MELYSLQKNSADSTVKTESVISDQHRITLQQTERPNALFKSSNVHFGQIKIKPRTVQFKPQQPNSIQNIKFIVSVNVIVQYPTLQPKAHLQNSTSIVQYKQNWILFALRLRSVLSSQLRSVRNHNTSARDRFIDEG